MPQTLEPPSQAVPSPKVALREVRLPGLDGLRGLAILLVLSVHSQWPHLFPKRMGDALFRVTSPVGRFGVPLFFVISGFLITYLLLQAEKKHGGIDLRHFWMKRALRIGPLVLVYALFLVTLSALGGPAFTGRDLASVVFFARNVMGGAPLTDHFWSLAIEVQFYLVWPLILLIMPPARRLGLGVAALLAFPVLRLLGLAYLSPEHFFLLGAFLRFDFILVGCLLAIAYPVWAGRVRTDGEVLVMRLAGIILCLASLGVSIETRTLCLTTGALSMPRQLTSEFVTLEGYVGAALLLVSLLLNPKTCPSVINSRFFTWFGMISYSLYVWQQFFMYAPGLPSWLGGVGGRLALAVLAGWISYRVLEKPFSGLRKKLVI